MPISRPEAAPPTPLSNIPTAANAKAVQHTNGRITGRAGCEDGSGELPATARCRNNNAMAASPIAASILKMLNLNLPSPSDSILPAQGIRTPHADGPSVKSLRHAQEALLLPRLSQTTADSPRMANLCGPALLGAYALVGVVVVSNLVNIHQPDCTSRRYMNCEVE